MKRVGIDIGGTNLRCTNFSENQKLIDKFKYPNRQDLTVQQNLKK